MARKVTGSSRSDRPRAATSKGGGTGKTKSGKAQKAGRTVRTVRSDGGRKSGRVSRSGAAARSGEFSKSGRSSYSGSTVTSGKAARSGRSSKGNGIFHSAAKGSGGKGPKRSVRSVSSRSEGSLNAVDYGRTDGSIDVRELKSEDLVSKTLRETAGPLGVASRPKVVDFSARLKERRNAERKKTASRVLAALAVVAVIAALVWFMIFSPVFLLEHGRIKVSGQNAWVSTEQVTRIADKQVGRSLFIVSSSDIEKQLSNIPGVTQAKVTKELPRGMAIHIHSQEPAAMLKAQDGKLGAVDAKGRLLNSVEGAPVAGIPVIDVDNIDQALKDRAVQQALRILGQLPKSMRQRISKVTARTQDSVTTELDQGGRVVIWGDSSQMKLKQAVVDKIVNDPTKIGDKHQVDVSAPLRPIIK